ncbi:FRAS1, partial [Symbiodinium pilosum]
GSDFVVTTSGLHRVLPWKWVSPLVSLAGTGVPMVDAKRSKPSFRVQAMGNEQLLLMPSSAIKCPLDTSMGYVRIHFPRAFVSLGLFRCPLILWSFIFFVAGAACVSRLTLPMAIVVSFLSAFLGCVCYGISWMRGQRTPMVKRHRQFHHTWSTSSPKPKRCERGAPRAITAGKLRDFLDFFREFIRERSMYYVCSNIVMPLTKPVKLSFAELIGPSELNWFVSHYWGTPVQHFVGAVCKHGFAHAKDTWRDSAYWICTFSNNQWEVPLELGNGRWQESSFYLALRSPNCLGTAMILDEEALPLQRIWCLFEVYQTILLSAQNARFAGLLLCTSTGVLQQGQAGTDIAMAVAKRLAALDLRNAQASDEGDRLMIHGLIEAMPGGFDTMNKFVRESIRNALVTMHRQFEHDFSSLVQELTASHSGSASASVSVEVTALPTLLQSRAQKDSKTDGD